MALRFAIFCIMLFSYGTLASVDTTKEKTLAIIKPDGVEADYVDIIKKTILDSGFSITQEIKLKLDEETVKSFYAEHATRSFFSNLVQYMTSGSVLIMVLEKENAIADWRALIGPTDANKAKVTHPKSIRALCGVSLERNCVHGSDSPQSAAREISFFFEKSSSDRCMELIYQQTDGLSILGKFSAFDYVSYGMGVGFLKPQTPASWISGNSMLKLMEA